MTRVCVFSDACLPSPNIVCHVCPKYVFVCVVVVLCFSCIDVEHYLLFSLHTLPFDPCPSFFCPVTGCLYRRYVTRTAWSHHSLISPLVPLFISCNLRLILSWLSFKAFLLPDCRDICILLGCSFLTGCCLRSKASLVHMVWFSITPQLYCLALGHTHSLFTM